MKTKLALTILGAYNALMGVLMLAMPGTMGETLVGAEKAAASPEILEMGTLFHYGLAPALLMIGLMLIFARSCAIETAKQLLLAYVISTGVLLGVFFGYHWVHEDCLAGEHADGDDLQGTAFSRQHSKEVEGHDHAPEEEIAQAGVQPSFRRHANNSEQRENAGEYHRDQHLIFHEVNFVPFGRVSGLKIGCDGGCGDGLCKTC